MDQSPSAIARRGVGVSRGELLPTVQPEPDAQWHPIARRVWDSFAKSGQVHWWQQSDWAIAFSVTDDLSRFKKAEEAHDKARAAANEWDEVAAGLEPEQRAELGFAKKRPSVPRAASPQKMEMIYRQLGSLLVTETDRRRAHIELESPADEDGGNPVLDVIRGYAEGLAG